MFDSGQLTVPPLADPQLARLPRFGVANLAVQAGDCAGLSTGRAFPMDVGGGTDQS